MTTLSRLDKAAVGTTAAAAAFKVLLWSVGAALDSAEWWLPAVRWLFALVSFVAFDLVVLAVVADQRAHGRRWLGTATAACAALLSGGVALHVAGVIDAPALHAGPAALLFLLALHLSDTRGAPQIDTHPASVTVAVDARTVVTTPPAFTAIPAVPEVVRLKEIEGLSFAQIGDRLGITRQAAWQRYRDAKKSVKEEGK